jgi:hypothetical protein
MNCSVRPLALRLAAALIAAAAPPALAAGPLPFVSDDWPAALAAAKARRLPLFVDSWAPW